MVADFKYKINKYFMGITKLVFNECMSSMFISIMYIFYLMVHSEQIVEEKLEQVGSELKQVRTDDGNSS